MSALFLPSLWKARTQHEPSARDWQLLRSIERLIAQHEQLTDRDVTRRAVELRERTPRDGAPLDDATLIEGSALVRESIRRTSGRSLYPVQLIAGLVLTNGSIAEIQTGEGKTTRGRNSVWFDAPRRNSRRGASCHTETRASQQEAET